LAFLHDVAPPLGLSLDDRDGWLNLLLANVVEPELGEERPTFLYDYPASQAALARIRQDNPPVAERFELYLGGMEICNGYHELTDPEELSSRMRTQNLIRKSANARTLPETNRLLESMRAGLPPSAGVALGVDRLVIKALGLSSIREVMAFPFPRA
jgi:lysyl-tRNA synthetase class 2